MGRTQSVTWELRAAFARRLAAMYGREVPAYETLVEVTREINAEVVGRDGSHTEVATWLGLSGATALPSATTPMQKDEIAAVQLVSSDGKVLLETQL